MKSSTVPVYIDTALDALRVWRSFDPSGWNTGLSAMGARLAQRRASDLIIEGEIPAFTPPQHTVIWCAANVFTAPLEWVVQLTANGGRVTLKAPSDAPESAIAIAKAFSSLGVTVHTAPFSESWGLLDEADAVIGFGATTSMESLSEHIQSDTAASLHGHMVSFAVVDSDAPHMLAAASDLAVDLTLYDGRGCMSPAAIFVLGDHLEQFADMLAQALLVAEATTPRGRLSPREGVEWRRRTGLSRILGQCIESKNWAVTTLPLEHFEPYTQPRMASIHKVNTVEAILNAIEGLPLSTCGTNLNHETIDSAGFTRVCRLGEMQSPPLNRLHDGVDLLKIISSRA